VDDIAICRTQEEHVVLQALQENGFVIHGKKCGFRRLECYKSLPFSRGHNPGLPMPLHRQRAEGVSRDSQLRYEFLSGIARTLQPLTDGLFCDSRKEAE
jgi:hypothetical protein